MDEITKARELGAAGYEALRIGDFATAREFGVIVAEGGFAAGFEIRALAEASLGNVPGAVAVLEEGVERCPGTWELWDLLGIYRADEGDFRGAHAAFEEALYCPEPSEGDIHIHAADALRAERRFDDALARIAVVGPEAGTYLRAQAIKTGLLNDLGRSDEAATYARRVVDELRGGAGLEYPWQRISMAEIKAGLGLAMFRLGESREEILDLAWTAARFDRSNAVALELIRKLTSRPSPDGLHLRLRVRREEPVDGSPGATYDVVAESREEALEYLLPFEPTTALESISVEDCSVVSAAADEPKGVLAVWSAVAAPAV